jgi:hypothetical protein
MAADAADATSAMGASGAAGSAAGNCVSATEDTNWTTVSLSTLCVNDINVNVDKIISVNRFNEINPNNLTSENVNGHLDLFNADQFALGNKDFIGNIAPENIKKILTFLSIKQKSFLSVEQLEYEDNLLLIRDISSLDYDVARIVFEHKGLNLTIINASNVNYTKDILLVNSTAFNISGCAVGSCAIRLNHTIYLMQKVNTLVDTEVGAEELNITTNAYINGNGYLSIVNNSVVFILNDTDPYLEILGTIEGFSVLNKSGYNLLWGSLNEGGLTLTDTYLKSSNSALVFSERYALLGDSAVFFSKNLSLQNISLYPELNGLQSQFIDTNSSVDVATIGYALSLYFSNEIYENTFDSAKNDSGNKILLQGSEYGYYFSSVGKLHVSFYDASSPDWLSIISSSNDSLANYSKAGSSVNIDMRGMVSFESGADNSYIGWNSNQDRSKLDFVSDGLQTYIDVSGETGDVGELSVGIAMLGISDYVSYKITNKNSDMQIYPNQNDLKRITKEYASTEYPDLSTSNIVVRLNGNAVSSDGASNTDISSDDASDTLSNYYAIDSSFITGMIGDDGIVSPIYPPTLNNNFVGTPASEEESILVTTASAVSNFMENKQYSAARIQLQNYLRKTVNATDENIDMEIMTLQSIYDLYSLENAGETSSQKKIDIDNLISEIYTDPFKRDLMLGSILVANSQDAETETELISNIDSAKTVMKGDPQINELLTLISKDDFDAGKMNEYILNLLSSGTLKVNNVKPALTKILESNLMSGMVRQKILDAESAAGNTAGNSAGNSAGNTEDNAGTAGYKGSQAYSEDVSAQINSLRGLLSLNSISIEETDEGFNISSNILDDTNAELTLELASLYSNHGRYADALAVIDNFNQALAGSVRSTVNDVMSQPTDSEGYEIDSGADATVQNLQDTYDKVKVFRNHVVLSAMTNVQMELLYSQSDIDAQLKERRGAIGRMADGDVSAFFNVGLGKDIYAVISDYNLARYGDVNGHIAAQLDAASLSVESKELYEASYAISALINLGVPRNVIKAWILDEDTKAQEHLSTYLIVSSNLNTYSLSLGNFELDKASNDKTFGKDNWFTSQDVYGNTYTITNNNKNGVSNKVVFDFLTDIKPLVKKAYTSSVYSTDFQSMIEGTTSYPGGYRANVPFSLEKAGFRELIKTRLARTTGEKILSTADNLLLNPFDITLAAATAGSSEVLAARTMIEKGITRAMFKIPGIGRALSWGFEGGVVRRATTNIVGGLVLGSTAAFIPGDNLAAESLRQVIYRIGLHSSLPGENKIVKTLMKEGINNMDGLAENSKKNVLEKINSLDAESAAKLNTKEGMSAFLQGTGMEGYEPVFTDLVAQYNEFEVRRFASIVGEENVLSRLGDDCVIQDGKIFYKGQVIKNIDELRSLLEKSDAKILQGKISASADEYDAAIAQIDSEPDMIVSNFMTGCAVGCPVKNFRINDKVFIKSPNTNKYVVGEVTEIKASGVYRIKFTDNGDVWYSTGVNPDTLYSTNNKYYPGQQVKILRGNQFDVGTVSQLNGDGKSMVITNLRLSNGNLGYSTYSINDLDSWNKVSNVQASNAKISPKKNIANAVNNARQIVQQNINNIKKNFNNAVQNDVASIQNNGLKDVFNKLVDKLSATSQSSEALTQFNSPYAKRWEAMLLEFKQHTLQGKFYRLAWTHNAPVGSVDGIFRSKRLTSFGSDRGLNFRYGLDNHYGDIVFVAKKNVEKLRPIAGASSAIDDIFSISSKRYGQRLDDNALLSSIARDSRFRTYAKGDWSSAYNPQLELSDDVPITKEWIEAILVPEHMYDEVLASAKRNNIDVSLLIKVPTGTKAQYMKGGIMEAGRGDLRLGYQMLSKEGFFRDPTYGGKVTQGAVMLAGPESFKKIEQTYFNTIGHNPAYARFYKIKQMPGMKASSYFIPDTEITLEPGLKEAFAWAEQEGLTFGVSGGSFRRARMGYDRTTLDRSDFDVVLPDTQLLRQKGYSEYSFLQKIQQIIADTRKVAPSSLVVESVGDKGLLNEGHYGSPSIGLDKVILRSDRTIIPPPSRVVRDRLGKITPQWDDSYHS